MSGDLHTRYGLRLSASLELADDPTGDHLDALLCATQAAWAYTRKEDNYGVPNSLDSLEGWIAHPSLPHGRD